MKFALKTDHPVAVTSLDHTHPGGTMMDSSRWHRFNDKLYSLFPDVKPMKILDMGCAGGGFVKDCLDDGHDAVGIEGSDYSLLRKRAEWATIPDNLFTADITFPFTLHDAVDQAAEPTLFHAITCWEVMEHLREEGIADVCRNVTRHLSTRGIWVMSVSRQLGFHHVTVKPPEWWLDVFAREGLMNNPHLVNFFGDDMIRGATPHGNAPESFHFVLTEKCQ